jgi:O-antigen/teichoic acid export membrane protein
LKQLIKTSSYIGATEIILIIVAVIKNKYLAVTLGPEGLGIYGLLHSFFSLFSVFSGMWLASGATKYISEYFNKHDIRKVNAIFFFSIFTTLILSVILSISFILLKVLITDTFLSDEVLPIYFMLYSVAFIALSMRPVLLALLQGLYKVKSVVFARLSSSVIEVAIIIIFVYFFNITGFFLSLLISSFVSIIIFLRQFRSDGIILLKYISLQKDSIYQSLLNFGFINIFLGIVGLGAQYLQRYIIVKNLGIENVGLFQAAIGIMSYMGIAQRGAVFHLFPRMSEELKDKDRQLEINDYLFFTFMISFPIALFTILFGNNVISVLYSKDFSVLNDILIFFVLSSFINNAVVGFQYVLTGMAKLKTHLVFVIVASASWIIVAYYYIDSMYLGALGLGLVVGSSIGLVLYYGYLAISINLTVLLRNKLIFILGVILLIIPYVLHSQYIGIKIIYFIISTSSLLLFFQKDEIERLKLIIFKRQ